jgi:hypothetical protein
MIKLNFDWKWLVGTFVSLLGLLATTIIFYYYENQSDTLGYQIVSAINVGAIGTESFDALKFKYNDEIIDSGSIVTISIENKRKSPIRSNDFEEPISIAFDNIKILDSSIKRTIPSNIRVDLTNRDNIITILPTLLNSHDEFIIDVLTDGIFTTLSVTGRVAGVKSIEEFKDDNKKLNIVIGYCCIFFALSWLFIIESIKSSSCRYKSHVAIHMLSYSFYFLHFLSLLATSLSVMIGFGLLGFGITTKNLLLVLGILFLLALVLSKLLNYNALIWFSERKEKTNEKHRFFQIALDDKITIIN